MLALLYALYASLAVLLLAPMMPPLQNADEAAHVARADQISHGGLIGVPIPDGEFGGRVDSGVFALTGATASLPGNPDRKATRAMLTPRAWGEMVEAGFPNTAVNPPLFYVPASLAALASRHAGILLPHALVLMRLAMGAATVFAGTVAIAASGGAGPWLFATLLLPMSLCLSASVSQDGPILACAALAAALFLRLHRPGSSRMSGSSRPGAVFALLCLVLAALGLARAPYTAFALLALACPVRRSWRAAGFLAILAAASAWSVRSAIYLPPPHRLDGIVSPGMQFLHLASQPWRVPALAWNTLTGHGRQVADSFIGKPGWLDVSLPGFAYKLAWASLLLALAAVWRPAQGIRGSARWLCLLAVAASCAGVALIQYMTWTNVGAPVIEGLQGRYFLPPAMLACVCVAPVAGRPAWRWPVWPVLAFPVIAIAVTIHAVLLRYYI